MTRKETFPLMRAQFRPQFGLKITDTEGREYYATSKPAQQEQGVVFLVPVEHGAESPYRVMLDGGMVSGTDDTRVLSLVILTMAGDGYPDCWTEIKLPGQF